MPVVKVTFSDTAKSGKPRVYFDGRNNWTDAYYLNKCQMPPMGATIDANVEGMTFPGKSNTTYFLNSWRLVTAVSQAPIPQGNSSVVVVDAPMKALEGWQIQAGDLSRFVSNVVGSAITSGVIKRPSELHAWTAAAFRAGNMLLNGLASEIPDYRDPNEGEGQDLNDEVPF